MLIIISLQYVQKYRPTHEQTTILLDHLQKHFFLVISHEPEGGYYY